MFSYSMVALDIENVFQETNMLKTAAFEAVMHANKNNDEMCAYKLSDVEKLSSSLKKKIDELNKKIEYIKNHGKE